MRLLEQLMKFRHSLSLLAAFAACGTGAFANEISDNIVVRGGTVVEKGDEVIITYTAEKIAEDGAGTLSFKAGLATARILAIGGGGGGGGTSTKTDSYYGAGGGGGAGGMVDKSGIAVKGEYSISVGAGGANVAAGATGDGGDGGNTTFEQNGVQVTGVLVAVGGGGGGSGDASSTTTGSNTGAGRAGGSGGGGSVARVNRSSCKARSGGTGRTTDGQGNDGGGATVDNKSYWIGGGGGGAGGLGTSVTINNQSGGAPGGDGRVSDITGESVTYASGGAGGARDPSKVGKVEAKAGGGGSGGTSVNTENRDGSPATGGGGGGAGSGTASGRGGSGVFIIRLSGFVAGGVVIPKIDDFVYDKTPKTAATDTAYYTVSGNVTETNAGDGYKLTLTLTEAGIALGWDDPTDPRISGNTCTIPWSIAKKPIDTPTTVETSYVYQKGVVQTGFAESEWYSVDGDVKATNAGTYTPTATLKDTANTKWKDDAAVTRTLSWTIAKLQVEKPLATTTAKRTYSGEEQIGFVENDELYTFDAPNRATNVSTYTPTATLVDAANTEWKDAAYVTSASRGDFSWTIEPLEVTKPTALTGLVYTNDVQAAVDASTLASTAFTLSGHLATDAGKYQFIATLNNSEAQNYKWKNGDYAELTVDWSIAQRTVTLPQKVGATPTYVYDGNEKTPFPPSHWYTVIEGTTGSERKAGEYSCTLGLNFNTETVTNVIWSNGVVTNLTWKWSITAETVTIPEVTTFVYDESPKGTPVVRTMLTIPDDAAYELDTDESDDLEQWKAGEYTYWLRLKDAENTVWSNGETDDQKVVCTITKAENEITGLRMNDWQFGATESNPSVTGVRFGSLPPAAKLYTYGDSPEGPWAAEKLTDNGYHYVRAVVDATENWNATTSVWRYCVWTHPSEVFSDYVDITVSGYAGSTKLTDFPVLVRVREAMLDATGAVTNGLPGFTYDRAGKSGENIRFLYDNGTPEVATDDQLLPFEIDKWDPTGESLVWVKVPEISGKMTTFQMYWHTDDPKSANDPTMVWSDYIGVWHFSEETNRGILDDSTGNGLTAYPSSGSYTAEKKGKFGPSLKMNTSSPLYAPNYEHLVDDVSSFTYLCWMKATGYSSGQLPFSGATTESITSPGAAANTPNGWRMQMNNSKTSVYWRWSQNRSALTVTDLTANWGMMGFMANAGANWGYYGFTNLASKKFVDNNKITTTTAPLQLTAKGFTVDEARLAKTARSADWMQAEFDSVNNAAYCTFGLVNSDGQFVNYWTTMPSITKNQWNPDQETITEDDIKKGALKYGSVTNWFVTMPSESVTNATLQTEAGTYYVFFDMEPTEDYTLFGGPVSREYAIVGHAFYDDLDGTASGRILLGNNDTMLGHEITGQAYWQTAPSANNQTWWVHEGRTSVPPTLRNLGAGTEHHLLIDRGAETEVLWYLHEVHLGSLYPNSGAASANYNYLPWSSTSTARTSESATISAAELTSLIVCNEKDAAIYSSCFTNGIGTIYFDGVNGFIVDNNAQIVVEIATNTTRSAGLEAPTDANCRKGDDPYYYLTHDEYGVELNEEADMWHSVTPTVLIKQKDAAGFAVDGAQTLENNVIRFTITSGKSDQTFYRVVAKLDYIGPVRFRIRRPEKSGVAAADSSNLILLDNIIVSPPAMSANLTAVGEYDKNVTGKQTLGWACAFDKPFPARTDTGIHGRAKISYVTTPGVEYDTSKFVASARLNYRWRYLNQSFDPAKREGVDQWKTVYLDHTSIGEDGVMKAVSPLEFPGAVGDLEWFYDMTLQAPTYKYVDYSGLTFEKPTGDFSEEYRSVTNRVTKIPGDRFASGGDEWFLRLREGKSDWQRMQVVIEPSDTATNVTGLVGAHDLELVDDNMWRGFVLIPTNAEGTCTFSFRSLNEQTGSPTGIVANVKSYGLSFAGQTAAIPANGKLTEGGSAVAFAIDHAAGYLEFKVSDRFLTFQVGRAEYQDFNFWNDAHTEGDRFRIDVHDTNSVNIAEMNILQAPAGAWPLFVERNHDAWDEHFEVADYSATDGRFVKNVFHQERHETPNAAAWAAQNITFVSENFQPNKAQDQKLNSGMAGKLLGNGSGFMDFSSPDAPRGIERIDLSARIGQSDTFDSFACCEESFSDDNYMLFVPVTMSHNTKADGSEPGDMAVGASVSLVGYHRNMVGCYEVRCERLFKGAQVRLSLWKWTYENQKYTSKRLCYRDFDYTGSGDHYKPICWSQEGTTAEVSRKFYGMFLSLETEYKDTAKFIPSQTRLICGLSNGRTTSSMDPWKYYSYKEGDSVRKDVEWCGLTFTDTDNPHGWGRYGMTSKDCPAQFVMPAHQPTPFAGTINKENACTDAEGAGGAWFAVERLVFGDATDTFTFVDDRDNLNNGRKWTTNPGRCECFTNYAVASKRWIGLHAPTDVKQSLELYLKKRNTDESQWTKASKPIEVSGYGFVGKSFDLKVTGQWDVRLRTGENKAIDVVVDNITQYKWQADDIPDQKVVESEFYYSQCCVLANTTARKNYVWFKPARAEPDRPVSIRSPIMDGLGKLTFNYESVDKNAEIWVQVATNKVHGNLGFSENSYNSSINSVELGQQQDVGTWITVQKFKYDDLKMSSAKSVYLGWHNHPHRPLKGVWRIFVPPHVVTAANAAATGAAKNVAYGQIAITDVTCTDEPGFSDRSWRGWNMRTIGDSTDTEKRMNLTDMKIADGGTGLVGALNNSVNDVYAIKNGTEQKVNVGDLHDENALRLKSSYPAIYSPLLRPLNRRSGVGSVSFKARLYSTTGAPVTRGGGQVWLYGSKDPTGAEGTWKLLTTHEIVGSVFSNYTWSAGNELYTAIKLEIHDESAKTTVPAVDRIVLDEIVIGEKVPPTINFEYARPFRNNLFTATPIADILSPSEQPLAGESWGVQTKLSLQQLTDEIDVAKGFEVYFMYKRGTGDWGAGNWKGPIESNRLVQVGFDETNLVFRSVGDSPKSLVEPAVKGGEVVQFTLAVKYYDRGGKSDWIPMGSDWQQPYWFYPLDYNETSGGYDDEKNFAAYTVLDTVSPGRAWINEVNWNDGTKQQNGGKNSPTNQYIEICVPSGVDMTGWKLRFTDSTEKQRVFAKFGDKVNGIPATKVSNTATNGFEFFVLQSPATRDAGGIRYPGTTTSAADATWYPDSLGSEVMNGTLEYSSPYQFELIRPSGIIEHQFVLDGTNTLSEFDWAAIYDGTNLVATLNDDRSPIRFYAGHDVARKANGRTFASVGVTGGSNSVDTADWPGGVNTWTESMGFTPGRLNEGQVIPKNWFLPPNGTNSWVYFLVETDHIMQKVGEDTSRSILAVIPNGQPTNVVYSVDNWFEGEVRLNETNVVMPGITGAGRTYTFTPTGTTYVTARAVPQHQLSDTFGLDDKNPYTPAVLRWLQTKYGDASAEDIRLARFKGLRNLDTEDWLTLTDMYWLDIPPVPQSEAEWAMNDGTNWWLRGGIEKMDATIHPIQRMRNGEMVTFNNRQIEVTLYISNACTQAKWAPYALQGLGYESSTNYVGMWTSVTFKVSGKLNLSSTTNFLPFRIFTFQPDSFAGAEGDATMDPALPPFSTRIDILDPFKSPIGVNYGWDKYPDTSAYFKWSIDTMQYPYSTEKLKKDSTYKETPSVE